jgi:hypothetical protein
MCFRHILLTIIIAVSLGACSRIAAGAHVFVTNDHQAPVTVTVQKNGEVVSTYSVPPGPVHISHFGDVPGTQMMITAVIETHPELIQSRSFTISQWHPAAYLIKITANTTELTVECWTNTIYAPEPVADNCP